MNNSNLSITLPVRVVAIVVLLGGIGRAFTAYDLYGMEYAYHAAIPLLPICVFFCLFAFLMPKKNIVLSVIAALAGLFSASLI